MQFWQECRKAPDGTLQQPTNSNAKFQRGHRSADLLITIQVGAAADPAKGKKLYHDALPAR
ncbi:hypothetical protein RKLH11_3479 [Rhodobacteraceae bacterium KLH11]|nr:hypothetical protein RKLH11_3479 [Rhodobacteraceae bacterium KLH11]